MKKATAVLSVKFNSSHNQEKLMQFCHEDLDVFRSVPGLIEKYYIAEKTTGAISGIYLFELILEGKIIMSIIMKSKTWWLFLHKLLPQQEEVE